MIEIYFHHSFCIVQFVELNDVHLPSCPDVTKQRQHIKATTRKCFESNILTTNLVYYEKKVWRSLLSLLIFIRIQNRKYREPNSVNTPPVLTWNLFIATKVQVFEVCAPFRHNLLVSQNRDCWRFIFKVKDKKFVSSLFRMQSNFSWIRVNFSGKELYCSTIEYINVDIFQRSSQSDHREIYSKGFLWNCVHLKL